jgi:hypothetical protein
MIPGENSTSTFSKNTLRKGKKHNFTVVFMVQETFTKLSVHNQAELNQTNPFTRWLLGK